jgi:hypothetical protein
MLFAILIVFIGVPVFTYLHATNSALYISLLNYWSVLCIGDFTRSLLFITALSLGEFISGTTIRCRVFKVDIGMCFLCLAIFLLVFFIFIFLFFLGRQDV